MSTTYISITSALVLDMNANPVVGVLPSEAMVTRNFTTDRTNPILQSFTLDLTGEHFIFSFSETVSAGTMIRTRFRLQNESDSGLSYVTLQDSVVDDMFDNVLTIQLLPYELNLIKRMTELATSRANTWLAVEEGGIVDTFENLLIAIPTNNSLQVDVFIEDSIQPTLTEFDIDLDSGLLVLVFDETVRASSLNVSQITLQDMAFNTSNSSYVLTDSVGEF